MGKEILLSPEELYYLASLMGAKYMDYAYIAAMGDIEQNRTLYQQETRASLVTKGIIEEDFSGNIEIKAEVKQLLSPVFFGEFESSVDQCSIQQKRRLTQICKFHFYDDRITMIAGYGRQLLIAAIDQQMLKDYVRSILPKEYSAESKPLPEQPKVENITRVIAVKNVEIGKKNVVRVFAEASGILCYENEQGEFMQISAEDFIKVVEATVRRA